MWRQWGGGISGSALLDRRLGGGTAALRDGPHGLQEASQTCETLFISFCKFSQILNAKNTDGSSTCDVNLFEIETILEKLVLFVHIIYSFIYLYIHLFMYLFVYQYYYYYYYD